MLTTRGDTLLTRFRATVTALRFVVSAALCLGQSVSGQQLSTSVETPEIEQSYPINGGNIYVFPGGRRGGLPAGKLTLDFSGNLYGTTSAGGGFDTNCPNGWCGTAFELSPSNGGEWDESGLYDFPNLGKKGAVPVSGLILDDKGNLFGTTSDGGQGHCNFRGCGVVFELTRDASGQWVETVLYTFTGGKDGGVPGSLIFDKAGNLYGAAELGGNGSCGGLGCGVVFKLSPASSGHWEESVIYTFKGGSSGATPFGGLTFDEAGNIYGATLVGGGGTNCGGLGCGIVFELVPDANGRWMAKVLHGFTKTGDGMSPNGDPIFDRAGNLYGTTTQGGGFNFGVVFELTPMTDGKWKETVLYQFTGGSDGAEPLSLTIDDNGNLYSTTFTGGINNCYGGCGVIFKLVPQQQGLWSLTVLHSFTGGQDGGNPGSGITIDARGNLFGSTSYGGATAWGTIFEVRP